MTQQLISMWELWKKALVDLGLIREGFTSTGLKTHPTMINSPTVQSMIKILCHFIDAPTSATTVGDFLLRIAPNE
jgi:hypothetical protein